MADEIITEQLEKLLAVINEVRPEICNVHFGMYMQGFDMMINGMFGEYTPTPEQTKILNTWTETQINHQRKLGRKDDSSLKVEEKKPIQPNPQQMFDTLYGDFGL